jgi:hypothetical protein
MDINSENEKQYLSWYYESLKSISKIQARLAWIILLLSAFSILLDKQSAEIIKIPLINLDLDVKTIQIIIPLILSIIYYPGTNLDNKKHALRHLPYLSYALLFIGVKIYLLITYTGCIYVKYFYFAPLIILDVIFSYPLIKNRIKRFFTG